MVDSTAQFCPECGQSLESSLTTTHDGKGLLDSNSPTSPEIEAADIQPDPLEEPAHQERFIPGTIIADRYRIVSLLGRGGMGEVYRADDLKLRNPVALKFLSSVGGAAQEKLHDLFLQEVRIARRISHPNVCRVYDIVDYDGTHFISMQYVDGENLASLLKRIGRLPREKALDITRQLCSGLAAIHDRNVLLRDLKPSNIMIDGRGQVLIADFGLASLSRHISGPVRIVGTPAYMAPEQLQGGEATVKTDIYALGHVLYEIFTGQPVFEAKTVDDLVRKKTEATPEFPVRIVKELGPEIEEIILRCLERDPDKRPPSVRAVVAAFPGLDPLAAAIAAGETPSPEALVAACCESQFRPRTGLLLASLAVVLLILAFALSQMGKAIFRVDLQKNPVVLEERAREIVATINPGLTIKDSAWGYALSPPGLEILHDLRTLPRDEQLKVQLDFNTMVVFWYKASPARLMPNQGQVRLSDPPLNTQGTTTVIFNPKGNLLELLNPCGSSNTVASRSSSPIALPDWPGLFARAGLEFSSFSSTEGTRLPRVPGDRLWSWKRNGEVSSNDIVWVSGASFGTQLTDFAVHYRGFNKGTLHPQPVDYTAFFSTAVNVFLFSVVFLVMAAAALMARYNLKLGRGDRKGALRLVLVLFWLSMIEWLICSHHVPNFAELQVFRLGVGNAMFYAALVWLLYIALEPHARRLWPNRLISWSRVLSGHFRDPLVGRDILTGVILGLLWICIEMSERVLQVRLGYVPSPFDVEDMSFITGIGNFIAAVSYCVGKGIFESLILMVLLLLLQFICRRESVATVVYCVLFLVLGIIMAKSGALPLHGYYSVINGILIAVILQRYGLLTLVVCYIVDLLCLIFPLTTEFTAWYGASSLGIAMIIVLATGWALSVALAGQRLFSARLFDS